MRQSPYTITSSVSITAARGISLPRLILFLAFFLLGVPLTGKIPSPPTIVGSISSASHDTATIEYLVWALIYTFSLRDVLRNLTFFHEWRLLVPLLVLLIYAVSSLFSRYTGSPISTLLQLVGSTSVALVGARLLAQDTRGTLDILLFAISLNLALNLLVVVMLPGATIMWDGRWSALSGSPNYLGAMAYIHMFLLAAKLMIGDMRIMRFMFRCLLPAIVLIGTESATSIAAVSVLLVFVVFVESRRYGSVGKIICRTMVLIWVLLVISSLNDYFLLYLDLVGRDYTLTGRILIWKNALGSISQHVLLGHGAGVSTLDVGAASRATNFHNGFLQLIMEIGVVGILAFGIALLHALVGALFARLPDYQRLLPAFILSFVVYNLAESSVFHWRNPVWLMYCLMLFYWALRSRSGSRLA